MWAAVLHRLGKMGVQGRRNKAPSTTVSSWVMSSKPLVKQGLKRYLPMPFVRGNYPQTEAMSAASPCSAPVMRPRLMIVAAFFHHSFHIPLRRDLFSIREGSAKGLPSAGPSALLNVSSFTKRQSRQGHCDHSASVQSRDGSLVTCEHRRHDTLHAKRPTSPFLAGMAVAAYQFQLEPSLSLPS